MIRLVDNCDTFHIPVVNFVDNPGFLIGSAAERAGTIRAGARALVAVYQATMPWISILIRRCFGVAGAGHGNAQALNLRYAWPSGDWGRSEEHTSELQSHLNLVCRLLLEKK